MTGEILFNPNHVLLQTPEGNISRCMRHLNSIYIQRYSRRHGFDGQLFRGRYKSILVCNDSHLIKKIRGKAELLTKIFLTLN